MFLADITKLIQVVLELVPGCPPAPELAMRHTAQQGVRDWLGRLQVCLRDSRLAAFLGEDSPAIVPDWYAADLEHEAVGTPNS
jgi:hypothetical protein